MQILWRYFLCIFVTQNNFRDNVLQVASSYTICFLIFAESSHCRIWNIKFEKDIFNLIKKKFPNWFLPLNSKSNHNIHCSTWFSSAGLKRMDQQEKRISPPKAIVDSSPLQSAMDKNRECKSTKKYRKIRKKIFFFYIYSFESETLSEKICKSTCWARNFAS
jgi:hypothetical protein